MDRSPFRFSAPALLGSLTSSGVVREVAISLKVPRRAELCPSPKSLREHESTDRQKKNESRVMIYVMMIYHREFCHKITQVLLATQESRKAYIASSTYRLPRSTGNGLPF